MAKKIFFYVVCALVFGITGFISFVVLYVVKFFMLEPNLFIIIFGTFGAALCVAAFYRAKKKHRAIAFAAYALVFIYLCIPNSRDRFLRALYTVRPGMTQAQVKRHMKGFILEGSDVVSDYKNPNDADIFWEGHNPSYKEKAKIKSDSKWTYLFYRHSICPEYNADFGYIYFVDGKVYSVRFLPD